MLQIRHQCIFLSADSLQTQPDEKLQMKNPILPYRVCRITFLYLQAFKTTQFNSLNLPPPHFSPVGVVIKAEADQLSLAKTAIAKAGVCSAGTEVHYGGSCSLFNINFSIFSTCQFDENRLSDDCSFPEIQSQLGGYLMNKTS